MRFLKGAYPGWKHFILPISIISAGIAISYYINQIYGRLYDAIQNYRPSDAWFNVGLFCALAAVAVVLDAYETYELNRLFVKMRTTLINKVYKDLNVNESVDSQTIPQRIQEDTIKFCSTSIDLGTAFFKAAIKIPLFIGVITTLTNWWTGLIVLVAVVFGTFATKWISKTLVTARSDYESSEALLRNKFNNTYSFPQNIYNTVLNTYAKYNKELKKLSLLSGALGQTFVLLPFILLLPLYFAKTLTLGSFFQSVKALDKIISSLSVVIDNRSTITVYLTAKSRLESINEKGQGQ
jgi:putative ATP-binding cassette transporter